MRADTARSTNRAAARGQNILKNNCVKKIEKYKK